MWVTARFNTAFMLSVAIILFVSAETIVTWFSQIESVVTIGKSTLQIFSLGYVFFAIGMVLTNAFNSAGDRLHGETF